MKINEVCNQFLSHCEFSKQLSHHSITAYKRDLFCFTKFIGHIDLIACDKFKLKDYLKFLNEQGYAKKTIKRRLACLKSMFRWLELEEQIEVNPFHKIDVSFKLPRQLPRNIPKSDLYKMLATAKRQLNLKPDSTYLLADFKKNIKTPKDFNLFTSLLVVELLFTTGIRVGELVNIQLQNINLNEFKIKILGKGQRERFVFILDQEICNLLNSYISLRHIANANGIFLLVNSRGNAASTHFIRKLLKQTSIIAKVTPKITPHMYRHSAACQLLESGLDIRYVQRLLGHQSISTTELYTHVNDNILQRKIRTANVRRSLLKK